MQNAGSEHAQEAEKMMREQDKLVEEIFSHEDKDRDGYISHVEFSGPKHDELWAVWPELQKKLHQSDQKLILLICIAFWGDFFPLAYFELKDLVDKNNQQKQRKYNTKLILCLIFFLRRKC